jgi:hypothetical protein
LRNAYLKKYEVGRKSTLLFYNNICGHTQYQYSYKQAITKNKQAKQEKKNRNMKYQAVVALALVVTISVTAANGGDNLIPPRREVYDNGRIFDITHRYQPDMPAFETKDGIGQFLWLPKSMKNGSIANNSEMKLPTHTGTHVDAPGHVFDHYFDAGFDVDSLDLHVLNGLFHLLFYSSFYLCFILI